MFLSLQIRYSCFVEIHETLKKSSALETELPGKKIIKSREFLEKRREQLEVWLNNTFRTFQHSLPYQLVEFLDFQKYDLNFLLQAKALTLSQTTNRNKDATFTILEV